MSTPDISQTPLVDTNGWHTVSAVTYRDINKSIAAQKASPTTWEEKASDGSASVTGGTFGLWQLTIGGGNENLMLSIPLTGGTLAVGPASVPIPACTATVKVRLDYLPQPGKKMGLHVALTAPAGEDVASVEDLQPALKGFMDNAALKQLLESWLNENLQDFTALFATVDLSTDFAGGDGPPGREEDGDKSVGMSWLRPSWHGYAVAEPPAATLDNSVFAVLCLIDGATAAPGLVNQVSPFAIPAGADAGFLIAPEMVLKHIMMPSMPLMFKGIHEQPTEANFKIDDGGTRISTLRDLTVNPFTMPNGTVVEDGVIGAGSFTLQISGTELVITADGIGFNYCPGIDVKLSFSGRYSLILDHEKDIMDLKTNHCQGSGSVQFTSGMDITMIVLGVVGVVGALAGCVGGAATAAAKVVTAATSAAITVAENVGEDAAVAAEVTVTCLRGLLSGTAVEVAAMGATFASVAKVALVVGGVGVASAIPLAIIPVVKKMADGNYQDTPKITDLAGTAIRGSVTWPDGVPGFTLASAQLNGALQMGLKAS